MASKPNWPGNAEKNDDTKRPLPVQNHPSEQSAPVEFVGNLEEGAQEVHEELRRATITQITLALFVILAICYFAKLVLVTVFTSVLIAFILEPVVCAQQKIMIPRPIGSLTAVFVNFRTFVWA